MNYRSLQTIRYMGNKIKLLDDIIPEIESITKPGDVICDLMSGTNSIGYALKGRNTIISNDIQYYSYVIAEAILNCKEIPSVEECKRLLDPYILNNLEKKYYHFFEDKISDTYFSKEQCIEIDAIRYAIDKIDAKYKYLLLTILMSTMSKVQSTPGHFAQYMPKDHPRIIPLRKLSVYEKFMQKVIEFQEYFVTLDKNMCFNLDYSELLNLDSMKSVQCFYLDSPYTADQYSRFYHILETVCLYDNPDLNLKGLYRNDRTKSGFGYKKMVANEFEKIIKQVSILHSKLIISYSSRGVISIEALITPRLE